jgi:hypothetical protein
MLFIHLPLSLFFIHFMSVIINVANIKQQKTICKLERKHFSEAGLRSQIQTHTAGNIRQTAENVKHVCGLMQTTLLTEDYSTKWTQCMWRIAAWIPSLWGHYADSLNLDFLNSNSWNELLPRWNDVRYFAHFRLNVCVCVCVCVCVQLHT